MYFSDDFGKNQPLVFKKVIEITLASSGWFQLIIFLKTSGWFFPNHPQKHLIANTNPGVYMGTSGVITQTMWLFWVRVTRLHRKTKETNVQVQLDCFYAHTVEEKRISTSAELFSYNKTMKKPDLGEVWIQVSFAVCKITWQYDKEHYSSQRWMKKLIYKSYLKFFIYF